MIEVHQLTKVYGSTRAIDGVGFHVAEGEIVGFLGPNGAGKSTTMRIVCGALGPSEGYVRVAGLDVTERPREVKRLIGYLPEIPPVYPEMSVRDYVRFCAGLRQVASPVARVEAVLDRVGLSSVGPRPIGRLSKGFRQRVGIAQALVHQPRVLVLDEPASGLDPAQRVEIRTLVRELAQGDVTIVLSTHVLPEVEALCDRVIVIHQGRIVAEDSVRSLSGSGQQVVTAEIARPAPEVEAALRALPSVSEVVIESVGHYRITAQPDVREAVARTLVGYGLLALTEQHALEAAYLSLTNSTEAS